MVLVSLIFFALYIGGVIALHGGVKPLAETIGLLRDLLPERKMVSIKEIRVEVEVCK